LLTWFFAGAPTVEEDDDQYAHTDLEDNQAPEGTTYDRIPLKQQVSPRHKLVDLDYRIIQYIDAGNLVVVKRLVEERNQLNEDLGIDPVKNRFEDLQSVSGWTLLHIAAWNGSFDIVTYLLMEENCWWMLFHQERSCLMLPLHCACQQGHVDIAQFLLMCAPPDRMLEDSIGFQLSTRDKFEKIPVDYATPTIREWIHQQFN